MQSFAPPPPRASVFTLSGALLKKIGSKKGRRQKGRTGRPPEVKEKPCIWGSVLPGVNLKNKKEKHPQSLHQKKKGEEIV